MTVVNKDKNKSFKIIISEQKTATKRREKKGRNGNKTAVTPNNNGNFDIYKKKGF